MCVCPSSSFAPALCGLASFNPRAWRVLGARRFTQSFQAAFTSAGPVKANRTGLI